MVWMTSGDKKKYDIMHEFVRWHLPLVRKNAKVYNAWIKWCLKGGKYKFTADLALSYGWGPKLKVESLPKANGEYRPGTPDVVFIDKAIAVRYQKDYKMAKAKLLVESTVLHELVHWADWTADKKHIKGVEEGKEFEKEAYGRDVQRYF